MPKKGENIFRRQDGRWEARYIKGYDALGKSRYGYCYGKTYKEAKDKVNAMRNVNQNSGFPHENPQRRFFAYYCGRWLETRKVVVKESTYVKYASILDNHILPYLGGLHPTEVTPEITGLFTQKLAAEGLSAKTIRDILAILHSILEFTSRNYPGFFPQTDITYPKESKKETRVLTLEEQTRFTEHLLDGLDPCRAGILLALMTGMRIGEICALRWKDISLEKKTIRISATMQRLRDTEAENGPRTKVLIGAPKTDTSERVIPITDLAAEICGRVVPANRSAFLLTGTEDYMEPRLLQYRFAHLAEECGLEGVHFHTMRHTFATRCIEVGFELKSLSEILGHANTSITMNRYVHSSILLKRENLKKLSEVGL